MPFVAPCRCCRFERLLRWMVGEKLARRCEPESFVRRFANEKFEKTRAFEPPMPKQFRVKRYDNDRIEVERAKSLKLPPSLFEKMRGVPVRGFFCCIAIVEIFFNTLSGDAMKFSGVKYHRITGQSVEKDLCIAIVEIFFNTLSGDAMIFYAGEFPGSARNRPK